MKSYWREVGFLSNMTGVLIKEEERHTETPCDDRGGVWKDTAISQGWTATTKCKKEARKDSV